ncbi:uncharacterized protein EV422DRAFT_5862 [Fimicolochytrium jonesii]|uniref:uncharacterized protein n=1 Tax=Fimicolochytrium jonesii TaxID=1396493 RepID=UPI0022FDC56F|nr:uncharacterized protein EV422DRAFT_5862 [Fimicolochytrium jonesii]KAI8826666.1 hypothetical protein EV422DRAFT_5862 [Fimicolochytrium jonesii]
MERKVTKVYGKKRRPPAWPESRIGSPGDAQLSVKAFLEATGLSTASPAPKPPTVKVPKSINLGRRRPPRKQASPIKHKRAMKYDDDDDNLAVPELDRSIQSEKGTCDEDQAKRSALEIDKPERRVTRDYAARSSSRKKPSRDVSSKVPEVDQSIESETLPFDEIQGQRSSVHEIAEEEKRPTRAPAGRTSSRRRSTAKVSSEVPEVDRNIGFETLTIDDNRGKGTARDIGEQEKRPSNAPVIHTSSRRNPSARVSPKVSEIVRSIQSDETITVEEQGKGDESDNGRPEEPLTRAQAVHISLAGRKPLGRVSSQLPDWDPFEQASPGEAIARTDVPNEDFLITEDLFERPPSSPVLHPTSLEESPTMGRNETDEDTSLTKVAKKRRVTIAQPVAEEEVLTSAVKRRAKKSIKFSASTILRSLDHDEESHAPERSLSRSPHRMGRMKRKNGYEEREEMDEAESIEENAETHKHRKRSRDRPAVPTDDEELSNEDPISEPPKKRRLLRKRYDTGEVATLDKASSIVSDPWHDEEENVNQIRETLGEALLQSAAAEPITASQSDTAAPIGDDQGCDFRLGRRPPRAMRKGKAKTVGKAIQRKRRTGRVDSTVASRGIAGTNGEDVENEGPETGPQPSASQGEEKPNTQAVQTTLLGIAERNKAKWDRAISVQDKRYVRREPVKGRTGGPADSDDDIPPLPPPLPYLDSEIEETNSGTVAHPRPKRKRRRKERRLLPDSQAADVLLSEDPAQQHLGFPDDGFPVLRYDDRVCSESKPPFHTLPS